MNDTQNKTIIAHYAKNMFGAVFNTNRCLKRGQMAKLLSSKNIRSFLDSFDAVLSDCDGVLWNGLTPIPGAAAAIEKLRSMGKKIVYFTNNSMKSRDEYVDKCAKLGFSAQKNDIISSAYVAAKHLKMNLQYEGKVYIIGANGIQKELEDVGIQSTGIGPDHIGSKTTADLAHMELDDKIRCVVVGLDSDFSYMKMAKALTYIRRPGCHFVATNMDTTLPIGNGVVLPGSGSVVAAVQAAVGREPDVVCGKPSPFMFKTAADTHGLDPSRTLMIGDRLNTDIRLAGNCGLISLLVLTGVSSLDDVAKAALRGDDDSKKEIPQFYSPSLNDVRLILEELEKDSQ